jgi:hypothetical protein
MDRQQYKLATPHKVSGYLLHGKNSPEKEGVREGKIYDSLGEDLLGTIFIRESTVQNISESVYRALVSETTNNTKWNTDIFMPDISSACDKLTFHSDLIQSSMLKHALV